MYAELLQTPHPAKQGDNEACLLFDAVDPISIQRSLGRLGLSVPELAPAANIYAADMISHEVNKALWFPMKDMSTGQDDFAAYGIINPVHTNELAKKQVASCFGYTIVLSELLSRAGVEHFVGYGANHAFVMVPEEDEAETNYWYMDALWPDLNQDVTNAISGDRAAIPGLIADEIRVFGKAGLRILTSQLAGNVRKDLSQLILDRRWPVVRSSDYFSLRGSTKDESFFEKLYRQRIIATLYEPARGRQILDDYSLFRQFCAIGQFESAARKVFDLGNGVPEIDVRSEQHDDIDKIAMYYAARGEPDTAHAVVESYFSGFGMSDHPNVDVLQGDIFRRVAQKSGDIGSAEKALSKYETASAKQKKPTDGGRLMAAQKLCGKLAHK